MANFHFDINSLAGPHAGPGNGGLGLASARTADRFEHHLGQATRPPDRPPETPPAAQGADGDSRPAPSSENASETPSDEPPVPASEASDKEDRDDERPLDADGASEAVTAVVAGVTDNNNRAAKPKPAVEDVKSIDSAKAQAARKAAKANRKHAGGLPEAEAAAAEQEQAPATSGPADTADLELTPAGDKTAELGSAVEQGREPEVQAGDQNHVAGLTPVSNQAASAQAGNEQPAAQQQSSTPAPQHVGGDPAAASLEEKAAAATGKRGRPHKASAADPSVAAQPSSSIVELKPALVTSTAGDEEQADVTVADADKTAATHDATARQTTEAADVRPAPAPFLLTARNEAGHERNQSESLTDAQRVRFVNRVASAFRSIGDEGGEVRLRLSPPELGALRVELTVRDGVLNARLEAETTTARSLLLDNLPALRDRLAEQNIKVERFDVDVRDERRQGGQQFTGQADQRPQEQPHRQRGLQSQPNKVAPTIASRGSNRHRDSGELNIVI